ncbi:MAG: polysaccharide deacetylase family protein [bacterium]
MRYFLLLLLISSTLSFSQNRIAITFDDLPCSNCTSPEIVNEVIDKLIMSLNKYHVNSIGFVNEKKLFKDGRRNEDKINLLRHWLENGYDLGNHTFSHILINNAAVEEYEKDLLKGEIITRPLMKEYSRELKYYRHTQLRTGPTKEYKTRLDSILRKYNYTVAPVTMDNDEYIYAFCYMAAKEKKDSTNMQRIANDYLDYMKRIFSHYEKLSLDFLGYNVNHILLLHANELNADYLDSILITLTDKGYKFISLDEALTDKAFQLPEAISTKGISWIDRWKLAKGLEITNQPEISDYIRDLMEDIKKNSY